jgi:hypothetical protein
MRKITHEATNAFWEGKQYSKANTQVLQENGVWYLVLHGNRIAARIPDGEFWVSNAGWKSNVTKERLNGLPGVHVYQRKGEWYLNGQLWDGTPTFIGHQL